MTDARSPSDARGTSDARDASGAAATGEAARALIAQTGTRLPNRPVTAHRWAHVVFLHWRVPAEVLAPLVPPHTRPDRIDGDAWVGLLGYEFRATTVPPLPPPGPFARLTELVVEIPTVDDAGRHGVAYRTVDTQHVPAIVAARLGLGVPYTFAHAGSRRDGATIAHRSRRPDGRDRDGISAAIRVRGGAAVALGDTAVALTTRPGIHARHLGVTTWWRRQHEPWSLRSGVVEELRQDLTEAAGVPGLTGRAPDSVLIADGVDVRYAWGGVVR